jgi:hypothetical protein
MVEPLNVSKNKEKKRKKSGLAFKLSRACEREKRNKSLDKSRDVTFDKSNLPLHSPQRK